MIIYYSWRLRHIVIEIFDWFENSGITGYTERFYEVIKWQSISWSKLKNIPEKVILKEIRQNILIPNFFFIYELQYRGDIGICQVHSCENSGFVQERTSYILFREIITHDWSAKFLRYMMISIVILKWKGEMILLFPICNTCTPFS